MRLAPPHVTGGGAAPRVRAHHLEGVAHDTADIILVHGEDHHPNRPLLLRDQVEEAGEGVRVPPHLPYPFEVLTLCGLVLFVLHPGHVYFLPAQLPCEVLPAREALLDVPSHLPPELGVQESLKKALHPPLVSPRGQARDQRGGPGLVRILIHSDVQPLLPGSLEEGEGVSALPPDGPGSCLEVADVHRDARLLPDGYRLLQGLHQVLTLPPDVGVVHTAVFSRDLRNLNNLVCLGEDAWRVDEASAQAIGSSFHCLSRVLPHLIQLAGGRLPGLEAHAGDPHGAVADHVGDVRPQSVLLLLLEVLVECGPGDLELHLRREPSGIPLLQHLHVFGVDGGDA